MACLKTVDEIKRNGCHGFMQEVTSSLRKFIGELKTFPHEHVFRSKLCTLTHDTGKSSLYRWIARERLLIK